MISIKSILFSVILCVLLFLTISIMTLSARRPTMPIMWQQLQSGMHRDATLSILGLEVIDMRELKGFDTAVYETTMFGSSCYWHLVITYDGSDRLKSANAYFIHQSCGLFNTKPQSVFLIGLSFGFCALQRHRGRLIIKENYGSPHYDIVIDGIP